MTQHPLPSHPNPAAAAAAAAAAAQKSAAILIAPRPSSAHSASSAAPSPRPTPPSSTTTIPPQCFPSPTSIADLANSTPPAHAARKQPHDPAVASHLSTSTDPPPPQPHTQPAPAPAPAPASASDPSPPTDPAVPSSMPHASAPVSCEHIASRFETTTRSVLDELERDDDDVDDEETNRRFSFTVNNFGPSSTVTPQLSAPSPPPSPPPSQHPPASTIPQSLRSNSAQSNNSSTSSSSSSSSSTSSTPSLSTSSPSSPSSSSAASPPHNLDFSPPPLNTDSYVPPAGTASSGQPQRLGAGKRLMAPPAPHPHLANPATTAPLAPVSKAQFKDALDNFIGASPPADATDPPILVSRLRGLLDYLDALNEQLPLKVTNALFDALSAPAYLHMLVFLLSDVSARSAQAHKDVRKTYRYPYIVTTILANGNIGIRDALMGSAPLVNHLLSYLDGTVPLAHEAAKLKATPAFARDNRVIVINLAQILTSYLETNPDPLLRIIDGRTTFLPSLVKLLHVGSIPKLISSMIPERCVDDLTTIDPQKVKFDETLTSALNVLSRASIFHLLADAFVQASQTLFSLLGPQETVGDGPQKSEQSKDEEVHKALQLGFNVTSLYNTLVSKLVRAVRINSDMPACLKLDIYGHEEAAATLGQMVRAAVSLFRETGFREATLLQSALNVTLHVLRTVEADRERRVPSVGGQPAPLQTDALEALLQEVLPELVSVLIDLVQADAQVKDASAGANGSAKRHVNVRVLIIELMCECTRLPSASMMQFVVQALRFGKLAFRMMVLHSGNSALHQVVCRAVETGLLSRLATTESAQHWLLSCNLLGKVMGLWRAGGDAALRSAVLHLACCAHHWLAMCRSAGAGEVEKVMGAAGSAGMAMVAQFEAFWAAEFAPIVSDEAAGLCGPKPKRKPARPSGATIGRSFGMLGATSGRLLRRGCNAGGAGVGGVGGSGGGGAHLIASEAGHRFGYVERARSLRTRFDDVFAEVHDYTCK